MRTAKSVFLHTLLVSILLFGFVWVPRPALAQSNVTLLLHDVRAQIIQGSAAYDVALYFSLLDSAGNPIKDAAAEDFTLTEGSQQVQIASLASANDEPINVALLLDTSGSMVGDKMEAAVKAAASFISDLQSSDRVAVLTFDLTTTHRIDFTTDHTAARQQVELIQAAPGAGTCLYDAAYQTVQLTADQPAGRRAVILLTDGVDEAGGKPCSFYTADEVIDLASAGKTRVPIYTIGLGSQVDGPTLERISSQTGGRYQYSPGTTQLDALFGRLSDELRSQYVLHYTSTAAPGQHTLTLKVNYQNAQDEVSSSVELPALPYSIAFIAPADEAEVSGPTTISVTISGQGAPIQKVQFLANGVSIGSDSEAPYELEWDPTSLETGKVFLEAIAQDAGGTELARSGITVTYQPSEITATSQPSGATGAPGSESKKLSTTTIILVSAASLVLLGVVIAVLLAAGKRRRREKEQDKQWATIVGGETQEEVGGEDRTIDSFTPSENALAVLVILQSDDPAMLHQRIEITKSVTTLGRKADNDVIFAKDSPVSRHHAVIEERSGQLFLSEVLSADESGRTKPPAYGTFINGKRVEDATPLRDGDKIQLGKRVQIQFEAVKPIAGEGERTMDQLTTSGDEKTMDFGATNG